MQTGLRSELVEDGGGKSLRGGLCQEKGEVRQVQPAVRVEPLQGETVNKIEKCFSKCDLARYPYLAPYSSDGCSSFSRPTEAWKKNCFHWQKAIKLGYNK